MTEYLTDLLGMLTRKPRIGIVLDLGVLEEKGQVNLNVLDSLRQKFSEMGQVKVALIISPRQMKAAELDVIQRAGFSVKVFPKTFFELSFLLEVYDLALDGKVNIMVLGSKDEGLVPLFTACRNVLSETIGFALELPSEKVVNSFNSFLTPDRLEGFALFESSEPEYDMVRNLMTSTIHSEGMTSSSEENGIEESSDMLEADLFGPVSEKLEEEELEREE